MTAVQSDTAVGQKPCDCDQLVKLILGYTTADDKSQ